MLKTVRTEAERKYYDEDAIMEEMARLERQLEKHEIDEQTFEERDEALWERLLEARDYWASRNDEER